MSAIIIDMDNYYSEPTYYGVGNYIVIDSERSSECDEDEIDLVWEPSVEETIPNILETAPTFCMNLVRRHPCGTRKLCGKC